MRDFELRNCGIANARKALGYCFKFRISQFRISQSLLLFVAEFVADAPYGQDHLRVFGVLLDLGSQAIYVRVDRAVVTFVGVVSDLLKQVLARENAARIRREETK